MPLGGEGGWDYLAFDSPTRRLFISRGTKVVALNVDTGTVSGEIPNTDGVHGIAFAPEFDRGFTSNGRAGTVTIFDLQSLQVIGSAKTGMNPDAIVYDPASKRVFTMNGQSNDATAIDAATGNVLGTIPVTGKPEFAVADGAGHVYVNIEDKSEELQIDTHNLKVTAQWPLAPCQEPSGLAMDITHRRLFAGCHNQMMAVVDADSGKVIATPAIGARRGRQRIRSRHRICVCVERAERHANGGARRRAGQIFSGGKCGDATRRAHHGTGPEIA